MLELGKRYRDKVTGFTGIAVSRHQYLTGCDRYAIQPVVDKDGKIPDSKFFDDTMLVLVDNGVIEAVEPAKVNPGGPQPKAPAR